MIAIDHGALEAHYLPGQYSDVLLSPDLRILISPPGQVDLQPPRQQSGRHLHRQPRRPRSLRSRQQSLRGRRLPASSPISVSSSSTAASSRSSTTRKESCGCPPPEPIPTPTSIARHRRRRCDPPLQRPGYSSTATDRRSAKPISSRRKRRIANRRPHRPAPHRSSRRSPRPGHRPAGLQRRKPRSSPAASRRSATGSSRACSLQQRSAFPRCGLRFRQVDRSCLRSRQAGLRRPLVPWPGLRFRLFGHSAIVTAQCPIRSREGKEALPRHRPFLPQNLRPLLNPLCSAAAGVDLFSAVGLQRCRRLWRSRR